MGYFVIPQKLVDRTAVLNTVRGGVWLAEGRYSLIIGYGLIYRV